MNVFDTENMNAHLIIVGPDDINGVQITVYTPPRLNEHLLYAGVAYRVTRVEHLLTANMVRVHVIADQR